MRDVPRSVPGHGGAVPAAAMNWAYAHGDTASSDAGRPRRCSPQDQGALAGEAVTMNRTYGACFLGPLPRGSAIQDCVERRRRFEAEQTRRDHNETRAA